MNVKTTKLMNAIRELQSLGVTIDMLIVPREIYDDCRAETLLYRHDADPTQYVDVRMCGVKLLWK